MDCIVCTLASTRICVRVWATECVFVCAYTFGALWSSYNKMTVTILAWLKKNHATSNTITSIKMRRLHLKKFILATLADQYNSLFWIPVNNCSCLDLILTRVHGWVKIKKKTKKNYNDYLLAIDIIVLQEVGIGNRLQQWCLIRALTGNQSITYWMNEWIWSQEGDSSPSSVSM